MEMEPDLILSRPQHSRFHMTERRVRSCGRNGAEVRWPSKRVLQRPGIFALQRGQLPSGVSRYSRIKYPERVIRRSPHAAQPVTASLCESGVTTNDADLESKYQTYFGVVS